MTEGVLYKVTGDRYIEEARISAGSVKEHMPDLSVAIATDEEVDASVFDKVIELDRLERGWGASVITPELSPFDRTLFLDTDTYVCDDVSELFDILGKFDLAVALSSYRHAKELPEPWVDYNTGVVAYKDNNSVRDLLDRWNKLYKTWRRERDITQDQRAFTKAVHDVQPKVFTLASEYNVRIPYPGYLGNKVKILHGRHGKEYQDIASTLNSVEGRRVFWTKSYRSFGNPFKIRTGDPFTGISRLRCGRMIHEEGWTYFLKRSLSYLAGKFVGKSSSSEEEI